MILEGKKIEDKMLSVDVLNSKCVKKFRNHYIEVPEQKWEGEKESTFLKCLKCFKNVQAKKITMMIWFSLKKKSSSLLYTESGNGQTFFS